jgi:hypothetical protein
VADSERHRLPACAVRLTVTAVLCVPLLVANQMTAEQQTWLEYPGQHLCHILTTLKPLAIMPAELFGWAARSRHARSNLSSEERIRRAVRAAKLEHSPTYTERLRLIPPAVKLAVANSLFVMACDALYFQEIRKGRSPHEATRIAAQRLLNSGRE